MWSPRTELKTKTLFRQVSFSQRSKACQTVHKLAAVATAHSYNRLIIRDLQNVAVSEGTYNWTVWHGLMQNTHRRPIQNTHRRPKQNKQHRPKQNMHRRPIQNKHRRPIQNKQHTIVWHWIPSLLRSGRLIKITEEGSRLISHGSDTITRLRQGRPIYSQKIFRMQVSKF